MMIIQLFFGVKPNEPDMIRATSTEKTMHELEKACVNEISEVHLKYVMKKKELLEGTHTMVCLEKRHDLPIRE